MAKVNYVLAMVALGGVSATAAGAATPITVFLGAGGAGIPGTGSTSVSIIDPGAAPQFWYGNPGYAPGPVLVTGQYFSQYLAPSFGFTFQSSIIGDKSSTNPGIPTYSEVASVDVPFAFAFKPSPTYIQLAFQNGSQEYVGYAYVDSNYKLDYITYEAVPEPAAWALLIAGVGLAGAAVRTRRRKELAQAA